MEKTTIQISQETLNRLKSLKKYEREPYDAVLNNVFDEVESDSLTEEEIEDLHEALEEVKKGKTFKIEDVARELNIALN
tara:strand:+ start:268 stop:504 length:237 start_codon:yes stop_codon:yes gene_type:complete